MIIMNKFLNNGKTLKYKVLCVLYIVYCILYNV